MKKMSAEGTLHPHLQRILDLYLKQVNAALPGWLEGFYLYGITRLYYTFREHNITTKARAGEYAISVVPKEWHPILQESIGFRRGLPSIYRWSVRKRKRDALSYMAYITDQCSRMLQQ